MRKIALTILCALAGVGCFFGGESDTSTDTKDTTDTLPKVAKVTPGLYYAEYPAWKDSTKTHLQAEISISNEGTFRMFWIDENESVYERRGEWAQHDSSLLFNNMEEGWLWYGAIQDYAPIEKDTNSISQITDTSFFRREYTPLRQKPYWVSYVKKSFPAIKDGVYEFATTYKEDDTLPPTKLNLKITLKGNVYLSSFSRDDKEVVQDSASWYQIGSFLATEHNFERGYLDSAAAFAPWDTLTGLMMTRLKTISDASFQLWHPAGTLDTIGVWSDYSRKP